MDTPSQEPKASAEPQEVALIEGPDQIVPPTVECDRVDRMRYSAELARNRAISAVAEERKTLDMLVTLGVHLGKGGLARPLHKISEYLIYSEVLDETVWQIAPGITGVLLQLKSVGSTGKREVLGVSSHFAGNTTPSAVQIQLAREDAYKHLRDLMEFDYYRSELKETI